METEKDHKYPEDVVEFGKKLLNSKKASMIKWRELKKFFDTFTPDNTKKKVEKYCMYRALKEGILSDAPSKGNFYLHNGSNPKMEILNLYFTTLSGIEEYKRETGQKESKIVVFLE